MDEETRKALSRPTMSVETAGRVLGLGRNSSYEAVKRGDIPSIRLGGKIVVPTQPVRRMLGLLVEREEA